MRKLGLILAVVVASLGLSACSNSTKATIDQSLASLGAQSDLQLRFTSHVSGSGTAQAQAILKDVSMDMDYASPSGGPLSQSNGTSNVDVSFNVGTHAVLELRGIGSNIYLMINLTPISSLPGVNIPEQEQSELAGLQLLLGGRWFELPASFLKSVLPTSDAAKAEAAKDQAIERKVLDAISKLIDKGKATALSSGGYSESGTLASVERALVPVIAGLTTVSPTPEPVTGTYKLTLTGSGGVATGGSISITAPNGSKGNATVELRATVTHDSTSITAPTGATVITPALLKELEGSTGLTA